MTKPEQFNDNHTPVGYLITLRSKRHLASVTGAGQWTLYKLRSLVDRPAKTRL